MQSSPDARQAFDGLVRFYPRLPVHIPFLKGGASLRTSAIPWKRAKETLRRPWGPQALGILVIFLALLIIYHGTQGTQMLKTLDASLSGAQTTPAATQTAATSPETVMQTGLATMGTEVQKGEWQSAGHTLQSVEGAWLKVQNTFAAKGVKPVDLNGMTGDLAELQMAVTAKDAKDATTQVKNAESTYTFMAATALAGTTPSLDQMAAVISDLNAALKTGDITRAKADAQELQNMVSTIQEGF